MDQVIFILTVRYVKYHGIKKHKKKGEFPQQRNGLLINKHRYVVSCDRVVQGISRLSRKAQS